ncbi:MAG: hypothetical protein DRH24_14600 [Deltaproteobacteria bacterium]|nr:MAG: hypothetical protein DRH24_14600 [Deltaproteobacteria bacterium]
MQDKIYINTGLKGFLLLDRITKSEKSEITGRKNFADAPFYLGLESLAQLGACHVRFLTGFTKHAFLLKVNRCLMPEKRILNGEYMLYGRLSGQSLSAFSYILQVKKGGDLWIKGEFLYGLVDYDTNFKKKLLQNHYQKILSCLQSGSKTD